MKIKKGTRVLYNGQKCIIISDFINVYPWPKNNYQIKIIGGKFLWVKPNEVDIDSAYYREEKIKEIIN